MPPTGEMSVVTTPGKYAVVHYCPFNPLVDPKPENPTPYQMYDFEADFTKREHMMSNVNCDLLRWCVKTTDVLGIKEIPDLQTTRPTWKVIPVGNIRKPVIAVRDDYGRYPHQYVFVQPRKNWDAIFSARMTNTRKVFDEHFEDVMPIEDSEEEQVELNDGMEDSD